MRDDIVKHLHGLPFRFTGELSAANKTEGGKVSMMLREIGPLSIGAVCFEVDPARTNPGLGLLTSGHEVTVEGTIETIYHAIVFVENAVVHFRLSS